jgi:ribonuclease HI
MSIDPSRRSGSQGIVGSRARQVPTEAHTGSHWDYLRRHEAECRSAARADRETRQRLAAKLLHRAADTRNIRCAIESLKRNGDTAAGPDRIRLRNISRLQERSLYKELSRAILDPSYRPAEARIEHAFKTSGIGTRPIEIANIADRIIARALFQMLNPFLDPLLDENCLGSRRGISREEALIRAQLQADVLNRYTWLLEDLKDAFTTLPLTRLRQALHRTALPEDLVNTVMAMLSQDRTRGIPQGSPLSCLMLNIYLTFALDRPWKRLHPTVPMLRVVDDILVLQHEDDDAMALYEDLKRLVVSAGMQLKGTAASAIRRLGAGEGADWLGYSIASEEGCPAYGLADKSLEKLRNALLRCHQEPSPPLAARETLVGWLHQAGAAGAKRDYCLSVFECVDRMMVELGFKGLIPLGEFIQTWRKAYARFRVLRRILARQLYAGPPDGFAYQDPISASSGRSARSSHSAATAPTSASAPMYRIWTDGSCLSNPGIGGWAYRIQDSQGCLLDQAAGSQLRATNNRMELLAAIEALDSLTTPARVLMLTDSRYLHDGLHERLTSWRSQPCGIVGRKNGPLWARLAELCEYHQVSCGWVRGHSGDVNNEMVDQLATQAARSLSH